MAAPDSASELSAEEADFHASKIIPSWEVDPNLNGAHAVGHEADPRSRSAEEAETERAVAEPSGARSPDTIIEPVDAVSPDEVQITDDEPIAAQPVLDVGAEPAVVKSEPPLATTKPSVSKPPEARQGRAGKTRLGMGADVETPASPVVEPPAVSKTRPDVEEAPPAGAPRKAPGGTLVMDEPAKKPARKTPVTKSDADAPAPIAASKSFGGADEEVELPVGGESKGLGMKIGLGLVAVVAIGLGIKFLSGSSDSPAPAPTTPAHTVEAAPPPPPVTAAAPAPAPSPAPTPEATAAPAPSATEAASAAPTASAVAVAEPPPKKTVEKPEKPVVEKPVAKAPPVNRPPSGGNKPAAPAKPGGGVIIKETPF
jgi:hypothetical protein